MIFLSGRLNKLELTAYIHSELTRSEVKLHKLQLNASMQYGVVSGGSSADIKLSKLKATGSMQYGVVSGGSSADIKLSKLKAKSSVQMESSGDAALELQKLRVVRDSPDYDNALIFKKLRVIAESRPSNEAIFSLKKLRIVAGDPPPVEVKLTLSRLHANAHCSTNYNVLEFNKLQIDGEGSNNYPAEHCILVLSDLTVDGRILSRDGVYAEVGLHKLQATASCVNSTDATLILPRLKVKTDFHYFSADIKLPKLKITAYDFIRNEVSLSKLTINAYDQIRNEVRLSKLTINAYDQIRNEVSLKKLTVVADATNNSPTDYTNCVLKGLQVLSGITNDYEGSIIILPELNLSVSLVSIDAPQLLISMRVDGQGKTLSCDEFLRQKELEKQLFDAEQANNVSKQLFDNMMASVVKNGQKYGGGGGGSIHDSIETTVNQLNNQLTERLNEKDNITDQIEESDSESIREKLNEKVDKLEQKNQKVQQKIDDGEDDSSIEDSQFEIDQLQREVDDLESELETEEEKIERLLKAKSELEEEIAAIKAKEALILDFQKTLTENVQEEPALSNQELSQKIRDAFAQKPVDVQALLELQKMVEGQIVDEANRIKDAQDTLQKIREAIESGLLDADDVADLVQQLNDFIDLALERIDDLKDYSKENKEVIEQIPDEDDESLFEKKVELDDLESKIIDDQDSAEDVLREISDKVTEINNSQGVLKALRDELEDIEDELKKKREELEDLEDGVADIKREIAFYRDQTGWVDKERIRDEIRDNEFALGVSESLLQHEQSTLAELEGKKVEVLASANQVKNENSALAVEIKSVNATEVYIQPSHSIAYNSARDGKLISPSSMSAIGCFYNLAILPGWEKWKPTYRRGKITEMVGNKCNVKLEPRFSRAQNLNINQSDTLEDVQFDYPPCQQLAFDEEDDVIVQFREQDWKKPYVIGFAGKAKGGVDIPHTITAFYVPAPNNTGSGTYRINYWRVVVGGETVNLYPNHEYTLEPGNSGAIDGMVTDKVRWHNVPVALFDAILNQDCSQRWITGLFCFPFGMVAEEMTVKSGYESYISVRDSQGNYLGLPRFTQDKQLVLVDFDLELVMKDQFGTNSDAWIFPGCQGRISYLTEMHYIDSLGRAAVNYGVIPDLDYSLWDTHSPNERYGGEIYLSQEGWFGVGNESTWRTSLAGKTIVVGRGDTVGPCSGFGDKYFVLATDKSGAELEKITYGILGSSYVPFERWEQLTGIFEVSGWSGDFAWGANLYSEVVGVSTIPGDGEGDESWTDYNFSEPDYPNWGSSLSISNFFTANIAPSISLDTRAITPPCPLYGLIRNVQVHCIDVGLGGI